MAYCVTTLVCSYNNCRRRVQSNPTLKYLSNLEVGGSSGFLLILNVVGRLHDIVTGFIVFQLSSSCMYGSSDK